MVQNKFKNLLKAKEPVRIRLKALRHGNFSIYLDTYVNGVRTYEFLRLYLRPVMSDDDRRLNRETMRVAQAIKTQRLLDLIAGRDVVGSEQNRTLLTDYMARYKEDCRRSHRGDSYLKSIDNMGNYLRTMLGRRMATLRMKDVDAQLVRDFVDHLRQAATKTGQQLSAVSVYLYFSVFRAMMGEAVKDRIISINPVDELKKGEMPVRPETTRDYLDAAEVARLADSPCSKDVVKRAFMFCCFTGLRYSDVSRLCWTDISRSGGTWRLTLIMQKTQEPLHAKLSQEAVRWLPPRPADSGGLVFALPSKTSVSRIIRQWAQKSGIRKTVTFHTSRHSYATMALTAGADLYTVSKLLGHRSITTTTVYAAVVDARRDAATDGVSKLFQKHRKIR